MGGGEGRGMCIRLAQSLPRNRLPRNGNGSKVRLTRRFHADSERCGDARLPVSASYGAGMHIRCCCWGQSADVAASESVSGRRRACPPSSLDVALSFAQTAPASLLLEHLPALKCAFASTGACANSQCNCVRACGCVSVSVRVCVRGHWRALVRMLLHARACVCIYFFIGASAPGV